MGCGLSPSKPCPPSFLSFCLPFFLFFVFVLSVFLSFSLSVFLSLYPCLYSSLFILLHIRSSMDGLLKCLSSSIFSLLGKKRFKYFAGMTNIHFSVIEGFLISQGAKSKIKKKYATFVFFWVISKVWVSYSCKASENSTCGTNLHSLLCRASFSCFPRCKVPLGLREIRVLWLLHFFTFSTFYFDSFYFLYYARLLFFVSLGAKFNLV